VNFIIAFLFGTLTLGIVISITRYLERERLCDQGRQEWDKQRKKINDWFATNAPDLADRFLCDLPIWK
jgi:hypothetical protein